MDCVPRRERSGGEIRLALELGLEPLLRFAREERVEALAPTSSSGELELAAPGLVAGFRE